MLRFSSTVFVLLLTLLVGACSSPETPEERADVIASIVNQARSENDAPDVVDIGGPTVESLAAFTTRLRDTLHTDRPSALILDLRRNNGGNTFLYTDLLRTLIAYDAQPDTRLFVFVGRNTASAAVNLATDLDRLTDTTFVGEPTGGKPNTRGNEQAVSLPYSGLTAGLSNAYWQHAYPQDNRLGIVPDVPVALTSEAYFAGRAPVLEATRHLIHAPVQ